MKKRVILPLLMVFSVMLGSFVTAYAADSGVTFEDGKIIAFEPGSAYANTDLFDGFKGVMPGDTRTEKIKIQNKAGDCSYIKVYLRAVLHDETGHPVSDKVLAELKADERRAPASELEYMYDFLSQLSMKVKSGSALVYEGSPDKPGPVDDVLLATLRRGESVDLDVELSIPSEMGGEYAGRIGEVDWVFVVEGFDESGSLIQTGQLNWPIPVLGGLGILFIVGGIIVMMKKRKKERD